jgi:hypothetical protein
MIVHLKTNNLSLYLTREHKKIIKIEQVDFGIMFLKNMVLHEIYSKKSFCPNTFDQRLCIYNIHFSKTVLIILLAFLFT